MTRCAAQKLPIEPDGGMQDSKIAMEIERKSKKNSPSANAERIHAGWPASRGLFGRTQSRLVMPADISD
jgi:hypothetical protein